MRLVVVESPNKTKKLSEILNATGGGQFEVVATAGHFRDLPERELGVDMASFQPTYVLQESKKDLLSRIRGKAKAAAEVYLATDADREGEAISWHLQQALGLRSPKRMRFQEITEKALKRALEVSTVIDQHLVDAQQARRVLDRLVGYQVSPLLAPFGPGHSAGRVQSAALQLVVERELAREAFQVVPYWTASIRYTNGLVAHAALVDDKGELVPTRFATEEDARAAEACAQAFHVVTKLNTRPVERKPKAPFTTSTLQQAASVAMKLKPDATMASAQALFEKGFITYHRSDSVALSEDAVAMAREFIAKDYPEALPAQAPVYKGKASAQEAHEAIRPTHLDDGGESPLEGDELALYELIRRRFIACQCKPAVLSQTTIETTSAQTTWRARGATTVFPSFLRYVSADEDAEARNGEPADPALPTVRLGQTLDVESFDVKRLETRPPSRYTQATLIKAMEGHGIGRPSTFASTLKTLFDREYLGEEKHFVFPTPRGRLIDEALSTAFPSLFAVDYTAQMEERLDEIAAGKRRWKDEIRSWYSPFAQQLQDAPALLAAVAAAHPELSQLAPEAPRPTGKPCPKCSRELMLRTGKKGAFLACSGFPACHFTVDPSAKAGEKPCPKCAGTMTELSGKFGPYARCDDRSCGGVLDLSPPAAEECPVCEGPMRDKGEFFGCVAYPACKGTLNKKLARAAAIARKAPGAKSCPKCQSVLLERKGPRGKFLGCSAFPRCKHAEDVSHAATAR